VRSLPETGKSLVREKKTGIALLFPSFFKFYFNVVTGGRGRKKRKKEEGTASLASLSLLLPQRGSLGV